MARVIRIPGPDMSPERLKVILKGLQGKRGKVGFFDTAKYPDGTPVAYVAAINEYGFEAGGIPPRPTARPTIARESKNWAKLAESGSKAILAGNSTLAQVFEAIGGRAAGDWSKTMANLTTPALAPSTEAARVRKGRGTKPLFDTGLMFASLTHQVEDTAQ